MPFCTQFLLSKCLKDMIKPFNLPFSDELKGRVSQRWAEAPHSLKLLLQEILRRCRIWYPGVSVDTQTRQMRLRWSPSLRLAEEPLEGTGGCNHFSTQTKEE